MCDTVNLEKAVEELRDAVHDLRQTLVDLSNNQIQAQAEEGTKLRECIYTMPIADILRAIERLPKG